ncbi:DUF2798 domain-containing protein [Donghicola sp. C2-DW-16]|uniref:DUF2798 domain-containing protein n=1 Tax=Donghicola mangrovi TaxID=2729614 RepID=A0A850Q2V3_9RHOB|nr:DUF2798 domain-containing protein [Donghicola mangrovi]NVO22302.1 DUF2798 domain-containing protein [Donghicola mangrovi]NVO26088.1 DUF2798 domain-containing protein [Donghicola mangrovi]
MIHPRFAPYLFSLFLSGMMSCLVSGIATFRALGFVPNFGAEWMGAWASSWAFAFPAVLVVAPVARRMVAAVVRSPDAV